MKLNSLRVIVMLLILFVAAFSGCAQKEIRKPAPPQMPEWCKHESGRLSTTDRGELIIGVGYVEGIKSVEMARVNADGQARLQLGKLLTNYLDHLLAAYQDYTDESGILTSEEELNEARKFFARLNVRSAPIEDRYFDEGNNMWFSKSVITLDNFVKMLVDDTILDKRLNAFLTKNATIPYEKLPEYSK